MAKRAVVTPDVADLKAPVIHAMIGTVADVVTVVDKPVMSVSVPLVVSCDPVTLCAPDGIVDAEPLAPCAPCDP